MCRLIAAKQSFDVATAYNITTFTQEDFFPQESLTSYELRTCIFISGISNESHPVLNFEGELLKRAWEQRLAVYVAPRVVAALTRLRPPWTISVFTLVSSV